MTGALSSNAPLPPLDPFSYDDNEDTYRLPQLHRLSVDAAAPELRALLGEDALDEDVTRPNQLGPGRTVVLVEGEDGFMVGHSDVEHAPAVVAHA